MLGAVLRHGTVLLYNDEPDNVSTSLTTSQGNKGADILSLVLRVLVHHPAGRREVNTILKRKYTAPFTIIIQWNSIPISYRNRQ